jgi:hypothetical protein
MATGHRIGLQNGINYGLANGLNNGFQSSMPSTDAVMNIVKDSPILAA